MKKFNWLDWLICLMLVVVAAGGWWFVQGRKSAETVQMVPIQFVFETNKNSEDIANKFVSAIGQTVVFGERKVDRGTIVAAEVVPFTDPVEDATNGKWKTPEIAGLYNARVTIVFDGYETENAFRGSQEQVMVGKGTLIESKGVSSEGYIISVDRAQHQ